MHAGDADSPEQAFLSATICGLLQNTVFDSLQGPTVGQIEGGLPQGTQTVLSGTGEAEQEQVPEPLAV